MEDRKSYLDKLAASMKEWDAEIQKLEAKAEGAEADLKKEYQNKIEELRSKKTEAHEKYEELKDSREDAWEQLKEGIEKTWETMTDSIKKAINEFK